MSQLVTIPLQIIFVQSIPLKIGWSPEIWEKKQNIVLVHEEDKNPKE